LDELDPQATIATAASSIPASSPATRKRFIHFPQCEMSEVALPGPRRKNV
jgi:hypothetical protein